MKKGTLKRLLSAILSIMMVLSVVPFMAFATVAEDSPAPSMSLSVSSETGMPGDTVAVTVNISNNPGIASLKFDVEYDSVLTLTNIEFNSEFGAMITAPEPYTNPQPITMISPLADISANGVFATLTFEINENTPDGYEADVNITFSPEDIFNGEDEQVELDAVNGKVSVFHGIPGDINKDKQVNTKDAIALFRYVAGWNVDVDLGALDVNGDDRINTKDAIALFRYVAGWDIIIIRPVKHTHDLVYIEAKESTCTESGNIAYYFCVGCEKYYNDEAGATEITCEDTVLALSKHAMNAVEARAATCTETGNIAYWNCTICGDYFTDENGETKVKLDSTIVPALGHSLIKMTEKAATCTTSGNITYWYCEICNKSYIDTEAKNEIKIGDTVISATGHVLQPVVEKSATCTEDGNIAYWYCSACKCYYTDNVAENEIEAVDTVVPAMGHGEHLQKIEAVEATVDNSGNEEYWKCSECGKCYSDANSENEITENETIIPIIPSYTIIFVDYKNWPNGNKVKFTQDEDLLLTTYLPPEVVGYTFDGWYTTSTFGDANKKDYVMAGNTSNIILYAKWTAIEYTITYKNAPENSNPETYTVEDEIILTAPKWAGLVFSHWTDKDGNPIPGIEKGSIGDIELEANWKYAKNMAISNQDKYTYVGGASDSKSRYYFIYDIGTIENVVLDTKLSVKYYGTTTESYTRNCSYKVQTTEAQSASQAIANSVIRGEEWSNISSFVDHKSKTTTLGASYCPEIEVAKVKAKAIEVSGGYSEIDETTYTEEYTTIDSKSFGTETSNQTVSSVSYLFEEETSSSVTVLLTPSTSPVGTYNYVRAADVKVYAIVTYDPNSGDYYLDIYSMVYRVHDTTLFELSGNEQYSVNIESCDQLLFDIPEEIIPDMFYTVQYNANGGDGTMLNSVHELGVSSALLPTNFTRTGYTFGGWKTAANDSAELYTNEADICDIANAGETVTLYAYWIPHQYTINYNANGGTGTMAASQHTYDVAKALISNSFSRTGYTFLGWSTVKNAQTATYTNKASVKNLSAVNEATITLYAVWKANTYTVTLNANGGSVSKSSITVTYDGTYSGLPANPTRSNYVFLGWKLNSTTVTKSTEVSTASDHTLVAQWVKVKYTVTFRENDKVEIWDDGSHEDSVSPGLSKQELKNNGYNNLDITIVFDGRGVQSIRYCEPKVKINSPSDEALFDHTYDKPFGTAWDERTLTATISLDDLSSDCSFDIYWFTQDDSLFGESWELGETTVTIEATKK